MNGAHKLDKDIIEIDLKDIFMRLLKKAWLIAIVAITCAFAAFFYTQNFVTPMYSSDVLLFVNGSSTTIAGIEVNVLSSDVTSGSSLIDTYMTILKTRDTLTEIKDYVNCDYSITQLDSMISVSSVSGTAIFKVAVSASDPEMAEAIATAVTKILPNKIADIIDGSSVRVVDSAVVPTASYSPNYSKNAMMGGFAGAVAMVVIIVLLAILDTKVTSVDYIKNKYPDIPVLGIIPYVGVSKKSDKA